MKNPLGIETSAYANTENALMPFRHEFDFEGI
jgi:hypothetical protein